MVENYKYEKKSNMENIRKMQVHTDKKNNS